MGKKSRSGVLAAGLALFSMFFGAGDLIWPTVLGGNVGSQNFYGMLGLIVTGVTLPLLGLVSMMLFGGNYHAFFGRIGKIPGFLMILIVQIILGPLGSIPRLTTVTYTSLQPYFPFDISLGFFSVLAALAVLIFTLKRHRIIEILGFILTPILLLSLAAILIGGLTHPHEPSPSTYTSAGAFKEGLLVGYNTLDLIASFIFAPFVASHFIGHEGESEMDEKTKNRRLFKRMLKASLIAAGLLTMMYVGLTYLSSYYVPLLDPNTPNEGRLLGMSHIILGPYGAFVASIAVAMACLTTAIPIVSIAADYVKDDLMLGKVKRFWPLAITLAISCAMANLGFTGIANTLAPILQILCPALIVLSALNIIHKLYETKMAKTPVYLTLGLTALKFAFFP